MTNAINTQDSNDMQALRQRVQEQVSKVVIGQNGATDVVLVSAVVGGHVLLEGVPGVAKTLLTNCVARALGMSFGRIQFTPDMLPSDVTGNTVLIDGELRFRKGPVFTNVLLADEINRTPPKTQASLLEAMQERQVSIDGTTYPLPKPFLVVATQNPVEQEGTYPLPEAQLDRFLFKANVGYPSEGDEVSMLLSAHQGLAPSGIADIQPVTSANELLHMRSVVEATVLNATVASYIVSVIRATRHQPQVAIGASPRAAVHLMAASKAAARLGGRDFVTPDDVRFMAPPVLRHRLILTPDAELEGTRPDQVITAVLNSVPVPR
jgi:MoxR-like ATPase